MKAPALRARVVSGCPGSRGWTLGAGPRRLIELAAENGVTVSRATYSFHTTNYELVLPPGIVRAGHGYVFRCTAIAEGDPSGVTSPFRTRFSSRTADAVSGVFYP